MTDLYLLIRRTPFMVVTAHPNLFDDPADAASVVADVLRNNVPMLKAPAEQDGEEFAKVPVGDIFEHPSRYQFRLIRADFTDNGKAITPGLRVLNNDLKQGTVCRAQFMQSGELAPGGRHFKGWYDVDVDGGGGRSPFNGERLTTDGSAFGIDVSRGTSDNGADDWTGGVQGGSRVLADRLVTPDGAPS